MKSKLQKLFLFAIKKIITCKRANEDDSVSCKEYILFAGMCGFLKKNINCGVCIMQIIESGWKKSYL